MTLVIAMQRPPSRRTDLSRMLAFQAFMTGSSRNSPFGDAFAPAILAPPHPAL